MVVIVAMMLVRIEAKCFWNCTQQPSLRPSPGPTIVPTPVPTTQPSSQPTKDYGYFSYRKLKDNIKYSLTRDWSKYLLVAVIFIIISVSFYCYQSDWNMRSRYEYIAIPDRHDAAVQAVDIEYNQQHIQNSTAPPEAEMVMTSFQRLYQRDESDRHNAGVDIEYNQQYIQNSTAPPEAEMVILSVLPAVRTPRNQSRSIERITQ
jgi:hypothetical protein